MTSTCRSTISRSTCRELAARARRKGRRAEHDGRRVVCLFLHLPIWPNGGAGYNREHACGQPRRRWQPAGWPVAFIFVELALASPQAVVLDKESSDVCVLGKPGSLVVEDSVRVRGVRRGFISTRRRCA